MKKKLITTLLVLSMVLTLIPCFTIAASADAEDSIPDIIAPNDNPVWDGTVTDADKTWYTDNPEATEFHISTPAQFASINSIISTYEEYFYQKTIFLDNDLYFNNVTNIVSDSQFALVGNDGSAPIDWVNYMIFNFGGTFEGNSHSLIGIKLSFQPTNNYRSTSIFASSNVKTIRAKYGLASNVNVTMMFRDLFLDYCDIRTISSTIQSLPVGGLIGKLENGMRADLSNVHYKGVIEGNKKNPIVGGLIGHVNIGAAFFDNCSVKGTVRSICTNNAAVVGGLFGKCDGTSGSTLVTVKNSVIYASVSSVGTDSVGGIFGNGKYTASGVTISNCAVFSKITTNGRVGGLVGYIDTLSRNWTIQNVFFGGIIENGSVKGQLIGELSRSSNTYDVLFKNTFSVENDLPLIAAETEEYKADAPRSGVSIVSDNNQVIQTLNDSKQQGYLDWKLSTITGLPVVDIPGLEPELEVASPNRILGAQLELGESLTVNIATILEDTEEVKLVITSNAGDKIFNIQEAAIDENGYYIFSYANIAPKYINTQITMQLYINEEKVSEKEYSVAEYCMNMLNKTAEDLGYTEAKKAALDDLLEDVLRYGATAQIYTNTDAGNLPTYTSPTTYDEANLPALSPQTTNPAKGSGETRLTAAGIEYNNYNKLYFKVDIVAKDGSTYRVRVEDTRSEEYISESYTDTETIVLYSPALTLHEFADAEYRVVIEEITSEGTTVVTDYVYGTVNYVKNMAGKGDANANLTQAVYQCSKSAAAFKAAQ